MLRTNCFCDLGWTSREAKAKAKAKAKAGAPKAKAAAVGHSSAAAAGSAEGGDEETRADPVNPVEEAASLMSKLAKAQVKRHRLFGTARCVLVGLSSLLPPLCCARQTPLCCDGSVTLEQGLAKQHQLQLRHLSASETLVDKLGRVVEALEKVYSVVHQNVKVLGDACFV